MNYASLKASLKADEGVRYKPYRDTVGKLTIGAGRNLDDVGISDSEVDFLLMSDVGRTEGDLDRLMPWWRQQPENVQMVLLQMAFNMGIGALQGFHVMLGRIQAADYAGAAQAALESKWAAQVGVRAQRLATLLKTAP